MSNSASDAQLQQIAVDKIDHNPDNPRLIFRISDLDDLLESIRIYGIQVPISVYREGKRFVLIDGERRWRCALKLNKKSIPALVQEKPGPLENLLLMFNIHALREQWDLLTIALKLPKIVDLLRLQHKKEPTEAQLSESTGLGIGVIRRCKLLMGLPQHYKDMILAELAKPKSLQKLTEDFFIEMERALKTVERAIPEVIQNKELVRQILVRKFRKGVIKNRIQFREVAKIARAENVGIDRDTAIDELDKLFTRDDYSIETAYENSVGEAYKERDLSTRLDRLLALLTQLEADEIEEDVREKLQALSERIHAMLNEAC